MEGLRKVTDLGQIVEMQVRRVVPVRANLLWICAARIGRYEHQPTVYCEIHKLAGTKISRQCIVRYTNWPVRRSADSVF